MVEEGEQAEEEALEEDPLVPAEGQMQRKTRSNLTMEARLKHRRTCNMVDLVAEDVASFRLLGSINLSGVCSLVISKLV